MKQLRGYLALSLACGACVEPLAQPDPVADTTTGASATSDAPTTGSDSTGEPGSTGAPTTDGSSGSSSGEAPAVCGNGVVEGDEPCDDASDEPLDGCDTKCRLTPHALWTQSWDSGALKDEEISAVALDAAGNIYVVGYVKDADLQVDAVLRKLDPGGEKELLRVTFAGELGLKDFGSAVALGPDGSMYMAGNEGVSEKGYQGWVRKYDDKGKELWSYLLTSDVVDGYVRATGLALDGDALYFVGQGNVVDKDTWLTSLHRIDAAGQMQWRRDLADAVPAPVGVAVTPEGDAVLAAGVFVAPNDARAWIGAFAASGDPLWSGNHLPDGGYAVAVAAADDGTLYVTGTAFLNTADVWVARLDAAGEETWSDYVNPDYGYDAGNAIVAAPDGGFYLGGLVTITNQQQNGLVRRYDADGGVLWTDIYGDETGLFDTVNGLALGPDGLVAAGTEFVLMHGQNQWIRKYAP